MGEFVGDGEQWVLFGFLFAGGEEPEVGPDAFVGSFDQF